MGVDIDMPDFSLAQLDRSIVEKLLTKHHAGSVAGIYRLSPLQEGMLFESSRSPHDGNYLTQTVYEVDQELDLETFIAAWRSVSGRHDALRTTFAFDDLPHPVQLVHRSVPTRVRMHDWSSQDVDHQAGSLDRLLREHRRAELDLVTAVPLSFDLIKTGASSFRIAWHIHHLLIDGSSSARVLDELSVTYASLAERAELPVLPEPVQFRQHIAWLAARDQAKEIKEWGDIVGDLAEPASLSCIAPPRAGSGHATESIARTLDSSVVTTLTDFARRNHCTLHTLVQAAWALVIASRSGRADVCWGTILSGRSNEQSHVIELVGLVINTVPARTHLDPSATVKSWLSGLHQMLAKARRGEHVGLDRIRRASAVTGDEDLFETLFQFVPDPGSTHDPSPRLNLRQVDAREQTGYPLDMSVVSHEDLVMRLTFEPARVDAEVARQIIDQYVFLLRELVQNENAMLSELEVLPAAERGRLTDWSRSPLWVDSAATIPELFAVTAGKFGDHTAVRGATEGSLTYRELDRRSNVVAARLTALGVRPETVVGIAMPRTIEVIPILVGVMKAGGTYLFLDLETPQERLRFMLQDSEMSLVVSSLDTAFGGELSGCGCEVLTVASLFDEATGPQPGRVRSADLHPENLAFVTYTSGSTGVPKYVGMTHRNLIKIAHSPDYFTSGPDRRFLQLAPISFDASIEEIWGALLNGASLVMPDKSRLDIPEIADLIRLHDVTNLSMTTGLFHQFVDQESAALRGVDQLVIGGDVVRRPQCDRVVSRLPDLTLVNSYGPTEMTSVTTSAVVNRDPLSEVPIGTPISNTVAYVLDENLKMVPVGVNGELYAGGTGVTRGYLNDAGLTAARFVPDPFSSDPGARMYATGDTARWLPTGELEFVGRADRQVKIRGFRVELGEIEAKLAEHPAVLEVVVDTVDDETELKRLAAHVVPRPGSMVSREDFRTFAVDRLPRYMVPSLMTLLEKIPLNASGKVDRTRLSRDAEPIRADGASRMASTETEQVLAAIWSRFLGVEDLDMSDNFFDLGGDSILSMRVASAARQEGLALSSTDLFKQQTVAELASMLDARQKPVPADQRQVTGGVRPTPIQLWFLQRYGAENHFNQSRLLRWNDDVSVPALRVALKALIDHHDALRLRVAPDGEGWRQWCEGTDERELLEVRDQSDVPDGEFDHALDRVGDLVQSSLDLQTGPVIRAVLIRTRPGTRDMLALVVHHMAVDLVSWSVLLDDLAGAYRSAVDVKDVALPAKTSSFKAWSDHLHQARLSPEFTRHRDYWRELNAGIDPIPADGTAASAVGTGSIRFALNCEETRRFLKAIRGRQRVTGPELLLGATVPTFREWTRGGSVLVDLEVHGRDSGFGNLDVTRTAGWFTAVHPVRLDTANIDTLGGYISQVRDQVPSDPDAVLSYGIAKYLDRPDTDAKSFVDAEVSFNYLGEMRSGHGDADLFIEDSAGFGSECRGGLDPAYPLDVTAGVENGRLFVEIAYAQQRWHRDTVQWFADAFLSNVRRSVDQLATWEMDRSHPSTWLARLRPASPLVTAPMKQYGVPGVSVATITAGQVATWAHGHTGREERPVDERTMFQAGSVAKHLAAIAVMRLCEAGVISLDQPVNDLPIRMRLPTFADGDPVTPRHLLSHRSGLVAQDDGTDDEIRAVGPAGGDYEYSLLSYSIVEQMLAEITGVSFGEVLADYVFAELGLKDSQLLPIHLDASYHPRTAVGHSATGRRYGRPRRTGAANDLVLWTSAGDIARVGVDLHRAISRDEGVLLRRASAVEMLSGLRSGYGLGTVVKHLNSMLWIGHPGDGPGFRTIYAVDAHEGHGLVILANGDGATPMIEDLLVELGTDLVMRVQGTLMIWEKG